MRVRRVVTTRAGGVSEAPYDSFNLGDHVGDAPGAVAANRLRLTDQIGLSGDRAVFMEQVHGGTVTVVDGPRPVAVPRSDGLVTAVAGLALVVLVADCVPVLLADPQARVVAAVHAGRTGAAAGVVRAALDTMTGLGARPARVQALLGPAVCGGCYEVPAAMHAEVERVLPGSATTTRRGTPGLDLRAGLREQVVAAGVAEVAVDTSCTMEDRRFYSYRRDRVTGRFAGVVWME